MLCLELTESLFADTALRRVRDVLERLKGIGIKLAIDDFGTGYSPCPILDGLPFDELKIDRAFVNGIGTNASKHPLLKGMIELSHALNLSVVAEGAEYRRGSRGAQGKWGPTGFRATSSAGRLPPPKFPPLCN
jgi:EAL domain-containing protein (putative c-di-GMP-specific phosphodiesterase class I)